MSSCKFHLFIMYDCLICALCVCVCECVRSFGLMSDLLFSSSLFSHLIDFDSQIGCCGGDAISFMYDRNNKIIMV